VTALSSVNLLLQPGQWRAQLRRADPTLLKGSIRAFSLNAGGLLLGLVTQTVLARTLGTRGYGLYVYVLGWSNVAGLLCALEFANAAVRFVSAYAATEDWGSLRGFIRRSHQIVVATTLTVAAIGAGLLLFALDYDQLIEFAFLAVCALFPLTSVVQLQGGILLGLKRVTQSQAPYQVLRPALFAVTVIATARLLGSNFNAWHAVTLQFVATGVALSATAWFLRREVPAQAYQHAPSYHTMEWVQASGHFVAISIAQLVLSTQADVLIVGALLGTSQAGFYGAASQLASLVGFGATAIMVIAQPMIADLFARGELADLRRISTQILKLTFLLSTPVFFLVVALGKSLLHLYGLQFVPTYPVLVVLATSQLIAAVLGMLLGYLFTMTAHQHIATRIIGISAALNIVLTLFLTPRYGMIGTATATAISTLVRSVTLALAARRIFARQPVRTPPPTETIV